MPITSKRLFMLDVLMTMSEKQNRTTSDYRISHSRTSFETIVVDQNICGNLGELFRTLVSSDP